MKSWYKLAQNYTKEDLQTNVAKARQRLEEGYAKQLRLERSILELREQLDDVLDGINHWREYIEANQAGLNTRLGEE